MHVQLKGLGDTFWSMSLQERDVSWIAKLSLKKYIMSRLTATEVEVGKDGSLACYSCDLIAEPLGFTLHAEDVYFPAARRCFSYHVRLCFSILMI